MAKKYPFEPDYAVAPGATLKETLDARGIPQSELAARTRMSEKTISQIINGVAPITYDTAEKLELALGIPARFWNRRELSYREAIAKLEARERLSADIQWLRKLPIKVLKDRGFLNPQSQGTDLVRDALKFFGVSSVEAWQRVWERPIVQYRGKAAQEKKPGYVAAWLRIGDLQAAAVETEPFDAGEFRRVLAEIRKLTTAPASVWSTKIPELCASAGVVLVFTREIPSAGVSGATRWLTKDKALIQLSLKYKTDDQIWFTFFHEAGHILLHGKKQMFVEVGMLSDTEEEQQANAFARDILIPRAYQHHLPYLKNRGAIKRFAQDVGIAPGIVVGRLQHDKLAYPSAFNDLKKRIVWARAIAREERPVPFG